jgi:hypothetical protein
MEVAHAREVRGEVGELVVVGREQRLGPGPAAGEVLRHRPGDGEAVEGGGAAPDLVEEDQAPRVAWRRMCGLLHLDHEGRLAAEGWSEAPTRVNAIDEAELGLARGHEAAHLRHHHDERGLAQVGGLAAHVGR